MVATSLLVITSCEKSGQIDEEGTYNVSVTAYKGISVDGYPDSRALIETAEDDWRQITATWEEGDMVYVYKVDEEASSPSDMYKRVGLLTAQKDGESVQREFPKYEVEKTTLIGSIDGDMLDDADHLLFSYKHPIENGFSYTGQSGTLKDIDDNYDYATCEAYVEVDHKSHQIRFGSYLMFESLQFISRFALKDEEGNPLNASKLVVDMVPMDYTFTNNQFQRHLKLTRLYDYPEDSFAFFLQYDYGSFPYFFISDASRLGSLELSPSIATDVFFVAMRSNMFHYSLSDSGNFEGCKMVLTATVGGDTYHFEHEEGYYLPNKYYSYEVWMRKQ